jgi:uncharacterized protein YggE
MPLSAKTLSRTALLIAVAATSVVACDSAQTPEPGENSRQVTVIGSGQVQGTPDTLTANVGIEFTAPDVTAAMNQTNERQQAVIDELVKSGVERKDINTTRVSVQPEFGGDPSKITGYVASNSIDVKIRDIRAASQALTLIVNTGGNATRINSVDYSIEDDSQLVRDARARAFDDAKDRAEQYADLSSLTLGKVISISESNGSVPPMPMPQSRGAMEAAVPLEPGQQTVGFTVTVIWQLT